MEGCSVKSIFPEWYSGGSAEDRDAHAAEFITDATATVAFDASALLQLYRADPTERSEIVAAIGAVGDRLFVPYHAALEYQRGREGAIADQYERFASTQSSFQKWRNSTAEGFASSAIGKRVRAASEQASAELRKLVDELKAEYALTVDKDDVRDALDALVTPDRMGTRPTTAQIVERAAEYERRAPLEIPPGYLDAHKGAPAMYGDYLIWRELLDKASATKRPLLLVTNDEKSDWSYTNRTPRRELVEEMVTVAGVAYHHINLKTFLRLAKEHLDVSIADDTIDSVEEGSQLSDEEIAAVAHLKTSLAEQLAEIGRLARSPIADAIAESQRTARNPIAEQLAEISRQARSPIADAIAESQRTGTNADNSETSASSEERGPDDSDDGSIGDISPTK